MAELTGAKAEITKLYDEKIATPLAAAIADTAKLQAQLAQLSPEDQAAVKTAADAIIKKREGQEAFVPRDPAASLAGQSRNLKALEGFFLAVKGEKPATLSRLEKNAATHRYETLNQFGDTARVLAQAIEQAVPQNAELVATAKSVAAQTLVIENALAPREQDGLFHRALRELKTGEATMPPVSVTADSSVKDIIEQQLAYPMHSIAKASAQLQAELDKLPEQDKMALRDLTGSYRSQSTLPDMHLAQDNNILASLPALTQRAQGLQSLLTKVASGQKTEELTAQEIAAADKGAWETTNRLRMPVRALAAMANASNVTENGEAFSAVNSDQTGKFDAIIKLAGKISSKSWEMQKAITAPGVQDKLKAAIAEYRARPVDVPAPEMTGATATPLQPQQQAVRGVA